MNTTLEGALTATAQTLRDAGGETPELDARLLVCHAAALTHEALIARGREPLAPDAAMRLEAAVARRLRDEPVSRIRGVREFYGRDFLIDAHTLDPRPDTETLIDAALDLVARHGCQETPLRVLDLGTGSGCILLTLLAELPLARGIGTDVSEGALRLARENARRLDLEARAHFAIADWFEGLSGGFDLVVSNPPYIESAAIAGLSREVADYDPQAALDGGTDGLDAYRRIAERAAVALRPGGRLLVEIGATQGETVSEIFRAAGLELRSGAVRLDLGGRPRCVAAFRPPEPGSDRPGCTKMRLEKRDDQARV